MQKLKISIILLIALVSETTAQQFLDPFYTFVSNKPAYVITQEGDSIGGFLRSATEASGFIKRITLVDEFGQKHKFKAQDVQRFAIQPGAFSKAESAANHAFSVRKAVQTDFNGILDREWLIYDSQLIPRRKNKTGLLQLLNPGFDQNIKVYHHPNGSKAMPLSVGQVRVMGGEDRTFLVVKNGQKPQIVRKSQYKKAFVKIFGDDPDFVSAQRKRAKFKHFAKHIVLYNDLVLSNTLSAEGN